MRKRAKLSDNFLLQEVVKNEQVYNNNYYDYNYSYKGEANNSPRNTLTQ